MDNLLLPLADPKTYIRLLEVLDRGPNLQFRIKAWPRTEAPVYNAVSYTWGSPSPVYSIDINGQPFFIGQNGLAALREVSQHSRHVWIDSVCVNQRDLNEKAAQVDMMGSIFSSAQTVFACVGPHADESELLIRVCDAMFGLMHPSFGLDREYSGYRRVKGRQHFDEVMIQEWEAGGRDGYLDLVYRRFARAWAAFGSREYWHRIWIAQEVLLAQEVKIVCGSAIVPFNRFIVAFYDVPWRVVVQESHTSTYESERIPLAYLEQNNMTKLLELEPQFREGYVHALGIFEALQTFESWRSSDFRDRLYALYNIVSQTSPSMFPDYTLSKLSLVRHFMQSIRPEEVNGFASAVRALIGSIGLKVNDQHVKPILRERMLTSRMRDWWNQDVWDQPIVLFLDTLVELQESQEDIVACKLESKDDGFQAPLVKTPYREHVELIDFPYINGNCWDLYAGEDTVVGYLSMQASSGCYLVRPQKTSVVWLVGEQQRSSTKMTFVGYAIIASDWDARGEKRLPGYGIRTRQSSATVFLQLEDLFVLQLYEQALSARELDISLSRRVLQSMPVRENSNSYGILTGNMIGPRGGISF